MVPHDHTVTFYASDAELTDTVARFVADGLVAGETAALLITAAHLADVESELRSRGVDISAAQREGTFVIVDALAAQSRHTVDGVFDSSSLIGEMCAVVVDAINAGQRVRVFGELVAVLWAANDVTAAFELEAAWNHLSHQLPFTLLCAYPHAIDVDDREAIEDLCAVHAAVIGDRGASPMDVARAEDAQSFAYDLRSPGAARRYVAQRLRMWGRADLIDDAAIVVAELTTNAVLHARSEFVVAVARHRDGIRVAVRDTSTAPAQVRQPSVDSVSGRGLCLVAALSRRWGTEVRPGGKIVWAELG